MLGANRLNASFLYGRIDSMEVRVSSRLTYMLSMTFHQYMKSEKICLMVI